MDISFRPATAADAPALSAFASEMFFHAVPPVVPHDAAAEFVRGNLDPDSLAHNMAAGFSYTLATAADGGIVGYSGITQQRPQPAEVPGRALFLSKLYVAANLRGSGVAAQLMELVIAAARDRGCDGVYLTTHQDNLRAQRFYHKYGFNQVATYQFELRPGTVADDVIMYAPVPPLPTDGAGQ